MIIRRPKEQQPQSIEIGDVLYRKERERCFCYLITKTLNKEFPYGLVNLYDPSDYDEYSRLSCLEDMVANGTYVHYKGNQVAVEVGVNE